MHINPAAWWDRTARATPRGARTPKRAGGGARVAVIEPSRLRLLDPLEDASEERVQFWDRRRRLFEVLSLRIGVLGEQRFESTRRLLPHGRAPPPHRRQGLQDRDPRSGIEYDELLASADVSKLPLDRKTGSLETHGGNTGMRRRNTAGVYRGYG